MKRCAIKLLCEGDVSSRYPAITCSAKGRRGSIGAATFQERSPGKSVGSVMTFTPSVFITSIFRCAKS